MTRAQPPAGPTPAQRARLKRFAGYFAAYCLLCPAVMVGLSWCLRTWIFVPACAAWGQAHGLALLGFTAAGGSVLGSTYASASCNYAGGSGLQPFRNVASTGVVWLEHVSGALVAAGGLVVTLVIVVLLAWLVERALASGTSA